MEIQISKSKFKAHALELFRHVETTGEAIIVTDHGAPAVVVRKYTGTVADVRAKLKGSVLRYDAPFAPVADDEWEVLA
jgi:prevent-host-death family protein